MVVRNTASPVCGAANLGARLSPRWFWLWCECQSLVHTFRPEMRGQIAGDREGGAAVAGRCAVAVGATAPVVEPIHQSRVAAAGRR